MTSTRLLAAAATVAAVALAAVPAALGASGTTDHAFACFSKSTGAPGVWSTSETAVFSSWSSYAQGYWAPYAETTMPTQTKLGNYYLTCVPPSGMKPTGSYIGKGGEAFPAMWPYIVDGMPIPGVYPVVAPATS